METITLKLLLLSSSRPDGGATSAPSGLDERKQNPFRPASASSIQHLGDPLEVSLSSRCIFTSTTRSIMASQPLSHSELFCLAKKDEQYYKNWIEDDVQELAQRWLGVRRWIKLRNAITVLARFSYFATTALTDAQTLGEEFTQAEAHHGGRLTQILGVLLSNDIRLPKDIPRPLCDLIKDIHLITFYLFGDFYEFAKRVAGINYFTEDPLRTSTWINKLIGCISLIRVALTLSKQLETIKKREQKQQTPLSIAKSNVSSDIICLLCSQDRVEPTSTLCGHIFCWQCIHHWLKERNECPICRTPTEPSRLIHLINFK